MQKKKLTEIGFLSKLLYDTKNDEFLAEDIYYCIDKLEVYYTDEGIIGLFPSYEDKELNKKRMKMTLRELLLDESFKKSNNKKDKDSSNWDNNKKILDYLDSTKDCAEIKNILEMKLKDIYNEYLKSDEFQKSIQELIQDGRYYDYIRNYIEVAKNFVDYYS